MHICARLETFRLDLPTIHPSWVSPAGWIVCEELSKSLKDLDKVPSDGSRTSPRIELRLRSAAPSALDVGEGAALVSSPAAEPMTLGDKRRLCVLPLLLLLLLIFYGPGQPPPLAPWGAVEPPGSLGAGGGGGVGGDDVDCEASVSDGEAWPPPELLASVRRSGQAERLLVAWTRDCSAFRRARRYADAPLSHEEAAFPIAYSVIVHHRVDMLERLLRAVYAPQNFYCLHVDAKSPRAYLEAVRALAACFPNVFVARRLEVVVYASWSRVQADLNCMRELVERAGERPWRYFINLCGLDFPIKTNLEIVRALGGLHGANSVESTRPSRFKAARWRTRHAVVWNRVFDLRLAKAPPPIATPVFAGGAYVAVTRAFVEHVLSDPAARAFAEWSKDTYSPDEHLWATLQRMPGVPGATPVDQKYDVTDVQALTHLVRWQSMEGDVLQGAAYPPCRGVHVRGICINAAGDVPWVLRQPQLFVNKVDASLDQGAAVRCLERSLRRRELAQTQRRGATE
ncbi:beta-1,3-galactosyl-O-glycosyl-glycoprotein beta-1,6-N-acetylglucosaminyltransferase-like isoform X1 [Lethenteron reissneri]|uniref:beta-1,3-galactosyl-O-glycosyl-glycoprotein beta-1,6-N-acetylglucosaminyltransferase-like isoform X1 n=2 Tax=Lethenteron reissneri TaxID=7753 RepID=UPI002AB67AA3|nr:beta-1,3-galactosyl-O-glycosyl-glycoprotein beta-1,6-N-acetylglucosaminyltransferase-like isoform X1 [Lethenteron reissneri]